MKERNEFTAELTEGPQKAESWETRRNGCTGRSHPSRKNRGMGRRCLCHAGGYMERRSQVEEFGLGEGCDCVGWSADIERSMRWRTRGTKTSAMKRQPKKSLRE